MAREGREGFGGVLNDYGSTTFVAPMRQAVSTIASCPLGTASKRSTVPDKQFIDLDLFRTGGTLFGPHEQGIYAYEFEVVTL